MNLKKWSFASHVHGDKTNEGWYLFECPDLFELPVPGGRETRWVLTGGNRQYAIGTFDGRVFRPEAERLDQMQILDNRGSAYAWQTFNDAPGGRRIQIAWSRSETFKRGKTATMFNQCMTLPMELSLKRTRDGLRLARRPVAELQALRVGEATAPEAFDGELAEVAFACLPNRDSSVVFDLCGVKVTYNTARRTLTVNDVATSWDLDEKGRLAFRIFLDRVGFELFSEDGLQYLSVPNAYPDPAKRKISYSAGDMRKAIRDATCRVWKLRPIRIASAAE
jgi:sucrose-6-phosphate hydrolase SacC (GH32 family)